MVFHIRPQVPAILRKRPRFLYRDWRTQDGGHLRYGVKVKEIPVDGGLVAFVDDGDYELVRNYSWCRLAGPGKRMVYAQTVIPGSRPSKHVLLHRLILGVPKGIEIDHENLNGLDCQRHNIRTCTRGQNNANRTKYRTWRGLSVSSQFKGVTWDRREGRWHAQLAVDGHRKSLGYFDSEVDAARSYDRTAAVVFGAFARLNFPQATT